MNNKFLINFFAIIFLFLFSSRLVSAGSFYVVVDGGDSTVEGSFVSVIRLNTENSIVNTIEGDLIYDPNVLNVESINTGNSFVNLWIDRPEIKSDGLIHFSGLTPGGVNAPSLDVFNVVFSPKKTGNSVISVFNSSLYLNDGSGTKLISKNNKLDIKIKNLNNNNILSSDSVKPEKFSIIRSRDSSIFDDRWFISFNAIDKNSGIDRYEVCEFFKCREGNSPSVLNNQSKFYFIKVVAFDLQDNNSASYLVSPLIKIIFILIIFLIIFIFGSKKVKSCRYLFFNKL